MIKNEFFKRSILDSNEDLRSAVRCSLDFRNNHGYLMNDPKFIRNHIRTEVYENHNLYTGIVKIFMVSPRSKLKVLLATQEFEFDKILNFNKTTNMWDIYSERHYGKVIEHHEGDILHLL